MEAQLSSPSAVSALVKVAYFFGPNVRFNRRTNLPSLFIAKAASQLDNEFCVATCVVMIFLSADQTWPRVYSYDSYQPRSAIWGANSIPDPGPDDFNPLRFGFGDHRILYIAKYLFFPHVRGYEFC
jgi:hypothetical protein